MTGGKVRKSGLTAARVKRAPSESLRRDRAGRSSRSSRLHRRRVVIGFDHRAGQRFGFAGFLRYRKRRLIAPLACDNLIGVGRPVLPHDQWQSVTRMGRDARLGGAKRDRAGPRRWRETPAIFSDFRLTAIADIGVVDGAKQAARKLPSVHIQRRTRLVTDFWDFSVGRSTQVNGGLVRNFGRPALSLLSQLIV